MNLENGLTPAPEDEYSRAFIALLRAGADPGLWRGQVESLASSKTICLLALAGVEQATVPEAELAELSAGLESRAEQLHKRAKALLEDWPKGDTLPPDEVNNMEFMQTIKELT